MAMVAIDETHRVKSVGYKCFFVSWSQPRSSPFQSPNPADFSAVSPIDAIAKMKAPLLLVHDKRDVTVDHVQSVKMHNAMTKAGKQFEFVSLPLAVHYFGRQADRPALSLRASH